MSRNIIASLRKNDQLHGSLFQAAKELAHRADGNSGIVQISYSLLAAKCHQSRRTAFRHIQRLLDLKIIKRQRFWRPGNVWGINKYIFIISWELPARKFTTTAQMGNDASLADTLPKERNTREEREKFGSLEKEEEMRKEVLSWLTPGSSLWKLAQEF
jgi:hypothetical protein